MNDNEPRFKGTHLHPMDEKNRVVFPSGLRRRLSDDELDAGLFLARGHEGCLELMTKEACDAKSASVQSLPRHLPENRQLQRLLFGSLHRVDIDKQGRLLVPESLKALAGIQSHVAFVGVGEVIEVWAKERLEANEAVEGPLFDGLMSKAMGGPGVGGGESSRGESGPVIEGTDVRR